MRKVFMILVSSLIFSLVPAGSVRAARVSDLMNEFKAEQISSAEDIPELLKVMYSGLVENQEGIVAVVPFKVEKKDVYDFFETVKSMDQPDNPYDGQVFAFNVETVYTAAYRSEDKYIVCVNCDYRALNKELEATAREVLKDVNMDATERTRAAQIDRIIQESYSYDESKRCYSPVQAIKNGNRKMVCQGYSVLYAVSCDLAGVNAKCVRNETHSWNQVMIDGSVYDVDVTNNSGIRKGAA